MKKFTYYTNCVTIPKRLVSELEKMIDRARTISYKTLIKHIDYKDIDQLFPFYSKYDLHIKNDFAVRFYKSKFCGKTCYFIEHSSIEYIFLPQ